jgi:ABC-2 type transport system permease protein
MVRLGLMQAFMGVTEGKLLGPLIAKQLRDAGMSETGAAAVQTAMVTLRALIVRFVEEEEQKPKPELNENAAQATVERMFQGGGFMTRMVPVEEIEVAPPARPRTLSYQLAQSVSGMTVMMLMFGLVACGSMLLMERETKSLQRLLAAAVPRNAILWGKFLFTAAIGTIQLVVLFGYGEVLFGIEAFRDPVTLVVLCVTLLVSVTSFGMLIAATARTVKQAEGLSTLIILVMSALGGAWFPIQMVELPRAAEIVTQCTLTYWAMSGFQGMFWHQHAWTHPQLLQAIGVQWGFAVGAAGLALWFFRRRYTAG